MSPHGCCWHSWEGLEQMPPLVAGVEHESGVEEGTEVENKGLA